MWSLLWNFHLWLHWKLSFWQLSVLPVMKISSKWRHFRFSVTTSLTILSWVFLSYDNGIISNRTPHPRTVEHQIVFSPKPTEIILTKQWWRRKQWDHTAHGLFYLLVMRFSINALRLQDVYRCPDDRHQGPTNQVGCHSQPDGANRPGLPRSNGALPEGMYIVSNFHGSCQLNPNFIFTVNC